MKTNFIRSLSASAVVVALSLLLPVESQGQQRSGVEIWEANCGRCHMLQPTNKYYPKDWRSVGTHMAITARLTSAQTEAVIAFLISGARTDATAAHTPLPAPSRRTREDVARGADQAVVLEAYLERLAARRPPAAPSR